MSADLLVGRVADDAVDPGAERRVALERVDLADHVPEGILDGLLRIPLVARDSYSQAMGSAAIRGDKRLCCRRLVLVESLQQCLVPVAPPREERLTLIPTFGGDA